MLCCSSCLVFAWKQSLCFCLHFLECFVCCALVIVGSEQVCCPKWASSATELFLVCRQEQHWSSRVRAVCTVVLCSLCEERGCWNSGAAPLLVALHWQLVCFLPCRTVLLVLAAKSDCRLGGGCCATVGLGEKKRGSQLPLLWFLFRSERLLVQSTTFL